MEKVHIVTGAFGFSGSYLVKALLKEGKKVLATDTPSRLNNKERISYCKSIDLNLAHPKLSLVAADLSSRDSLRQLFTDVGSIGIVYHTASLYNYSAGLSLLRKVNVQGTANLLAELPIDIDQFIHWSTCGVFGKPIKKGVLAGLPFTETSESPKTMSPRAKRPAITPLVNEYSISKWEQEQMLWKKCKEEGFPLTVIRPAPIYGPGSKYGHGGIIVAVATGLLPFIPVASKHSKTISVHVEDLAHFALYVSGKEECIGEDYNCVDSTDISYYDFIHFIARVLGKEIIDVSHFPMGLMRAITFSVATFINALNLKKYYPQLSIVETQSAKYIGSSYKVSNEKSKSIGFEYKYEDVKIGIKDTVSWFSKQGWI